MSALLGQVALGVLPPLVLGVLLWGVVWRPWRPRGPASPAAAPGGGDDRRAWATPLVLGGGYALAHLALHGFALTGNLDVKERLFWSSLAVAGLGLLEVLLRPRTALVLALRWATAAGLLAFLLAFRLRLRDGWSGVELGAWAAAFGLAVLLLGSLGEREAARAGGPAPLLALCGVAAAAGAALHLTGSASLGQLAGSVSAAAGLGAALAWRVPEFRARGALQPATLLLAGLLLAGHYTSELPPGPALLLASGLAVAPLVPGRRASLPRALGVLLLVAALAGVALWRAHAALPPDPYAGF